MEEYRRMKSHSSLSIVGSNRKSLRFSGRRKRSESTDKLDGSKHVLFGNLASKSASGLLNKVVGQLSSVSTAALVPRVASADSYEGRLPLVGNEVTGRSIISRKSTSTKNDPLIVNSIHNSSTKTVQSNTIPRNDAKNANVCLDGKSVLSNKRSDSNAFKSTLINARADDNSSADFSSCKSATINPRAGSKTSVDFSTCKSAIISRGDGKTTVDFSNSYKSALSSRADCKTSCDFSGNKSSINSFLDLKNSNLQRSSALSSANSRESLKITASSLNAVVKSLPVCARAEVKSGTISRAEVKSTTLKNTSLADKSGLCATMKATQTLPCAVRASGKFGGTCGIQNHGNTCYMNAILQCLGNTQQLTEYLIFHGKLLGLQAQNKELSSQLANLLKSLWLCQYSPEISYAFKLLVGKYGPQYEGTRQHDAQEFFLWLINHIHEELRSCGSSLSPRLTKSAPHSYHSQSEQPAKNGNSSHSTIIHNLFQGHMRSTLNCTNCGRSSDTFDTFLCMSLPIPCNQKVPLFVNLIPHTARPKVIRGGLLISSYASIRDLRRKLSDDSSIPEQQLILTETKDDDYHRTLPDSESVSVLQDFQQIYAFEVPKQQAKDRRENMLLMCFNRMYPGDNQMIGPPLLIDVPREISYEGMRKRLLQKIELILKMKNGQIVTKTPRFYVAGVSHNHCYLPESVDHPLYMPCVDEALEIFEDNQFYGPPHLKLLVEWDVRLKDRSSLLNESFPFTVDSKSYLQLRERRSGMTQRSLYDCFNLYFKREKLDREDSWECQACNCRQQGMKQLSLVSLPEILVIHLKRFKQDSKERTKLQVMVDFPVTGLNMTSFVGQKKRNQRVPQHTESDRVPLPCQHSKRDLLVDSDNTYDLYAVCSHRGDMQSGHYIAYCKNPVDKSWYLFNDTKVVSVQEREVVTKDAYILFYQRSTREDSSPSPSSSSSGYSTASSTSFSGSEHEISLNNTNNNQSSVSNVPSVNEKKFENSNDSSHQLQERVKRPLSESSQSNDSLADTHFADLTSLSIQEKNTLKSTVSKPTFSSRFSSKSSSVPKICEDIDDLKFIEDDSSESSRRWFVTVTSV